MHILITDIIHLITFKRSTWFPFLNRATWGVVTNRLSLHFFFVSSWTTWNKPNEFIFLYAPIWLYITCMPFTYKTSHQCAVNHPNLMNTYVLAVSVGWMEIRDYRTAHETTQVDTYIGDCHKSCNSKVIHLKLLQSTIF